MSVSYRHRISLLIPLLVLGLYSAYPTRLRAAQAQSGPKADSNPFAQDAARLDAGRVRFEQVCSNCHGAGGEGGQGEGHGPNLVDNPNIRRAKDVGIFNTIRNGVPGTPMPRFALPDAALWELVAFIRSLSATAITMNVAGDPKQGETIFFAKGQCGTCHMILGRGGYLGPDLSNIGSTARLADLRKSLTSSASSPEDGFRPALLEVSGGKTVKAIVKHRTNWSMDLLDENGQLHLLSGPEMKRVTMPDHAGTHDYSNQLTAGELQDVLAFLSRQSVSVEAASKSASSPPPETGTARALVRDSDLEAGPNQNWLTYIGDYAAHRHSPLTTINVANVSRLVPKWVRHFDAPVYLEATPLVYQGVMYTTSSNRVDALDAVTGKEIWHYEATGETHRSVSRGVAIWRDRVFFETSGCHLVALIRASGSMVWDKPYGDGFSCSGVPLVVKGKVIVGVASSGKTCFVAALSGETGDELWRFWSVPRKGEFGADSWGKFPLDWGGGPTWTPGSYDPQLNLLYWPTGNPWPDFYGGDRPGDNLYSDCILALDADSGKLKWYFQFTPHDTHDWDANETPVLFDAAVGGQARKLLLQADRNGFYYVLDRTNGKFLTGRPFIKELNWATGLDDSGRPVLAPQMDPTTGGTRVCPTVHGATNWWAPTLDPKLGLFFVVALEKCETYFSSPKEPVPNSGFRGTGHTESGMMRSSALPGESGEFYLRALNSLTGKLVWEYPMPGLTTMWAGTASTDGGLVFTADDDGDLVALDSKTGKDLWHFSMGDKNHASPMTFAVGSQQYVSIANGTNLFTFGLPER